MADDANETTPNEAHWMATDVESQPPRDTVAGLPRMVLETQSRLGTGATAEAVAAELRARGVEVTAADVEKCNETPY